MSCFIDSSTGMPCCRHRTRRVASELALDALRRTLTHAEGAGT
jgi:hypothetical protein